MIARKIIQTGGVQFVSVGLGVLTGVFIARLLGPEGRGVFAIFKANIELLVLLLSFGIGSVTAYYVSNKEIEMKKILGISVLVISLAIIGFVSLLLVLQLMPQVKGIFLPAGYDGLFFQLYIGAALMLRILISIATGLLNGKKLFNQTNLFKLINAFVLLCLIAGLYYLTATNDNLRNLQLVFTISASVLILNFFLLAMAIIKKLRKELKVSMNVTHELVPAFAFIKIVYLSELLNFLNYRLDVWLVEYYTNSYDLGLYALSVGISQFLWLVVTPITMVLMPHLNDPNLNFIDKRGIFLFYSRLLFVCLIAVSSILFFTCDWIVPMVYGVDFTYSSELLKYLIPGIVFSSMTKILGIFILTNGQVKYNLVAVVVGLFFTVLLDIILIPSIGTVGASIATSVSYFFIFLTCFLTVSLKLNVGFNLFIPTKSDWRRFQNKLAKNE